MKSKYSSDEANAYKEWMDEFESRLDSLPQLDVETHEGPMAANKILKSATSVFYYVSLFSASLLLISFFWGSGLSAWAINYSGDFIKLSPFMVK
jgi:hypothetical protein